MKILLVRHGETEWNSLNKIQGSTDIPLNENGIEQAKKLTQQLITHYPHISKVYCSIQKRAKQTAQILNANPETIIGIEEVKFGLWEGLTWKDVQEKYPIEYKEWYENRRYTKPPHGESYQEVLERTLKAIREIIATNHNDVVMVTHGGVILTILSYLNSTPFEDMARYKSGNASIVLLDTDLLTTVQASEESKKMTEINYKIYDSFVTHFAELTQELDAELLAKNGQSQSIYNKYNNIEDIHDIVIAYVDDQAIGCASIKKYSHDTFEIKRVYVKAPYRKLGVAKNMMAKLEILASSKGIRNLILETGKDFIPAQKLYLSLNYKLIENYGQYKGMVKSVCLGKTINPVE